MEKIYQGENLNIVFRCKNRDGSAAGMSGKKVVVVWLDRRDRQMFRFSTEPRGTEKPLRVSGNILMCELLRSDTVLLDGLNSIEVKVSENDGPMIERVDGIRVWRSVLGKEASK